MPPLPPHRLSLLLCGLLFAACGKQETPPRTRIACVGDSITWGHKIPGREANCYPTRLAEILGPDVEVGNFAANGLTLLKSGNLPIWDSPVLGEALRFAPDVVVIQLGSNDIKPGNWKRKDAFADDFDDLIGRFRAVSPDVALFIALPTPVFPEASGIRNDIMEAELLPLIRSIAESHDAVLIDVHTPLLARPDCFPDKLHPSADGARLMAEIIAGYLNACIQKISRSD